MFSERSKHSNVLTVFFSIMQTLEKNITGTLHFLILPSLWERYLWMFSERFETSIITLKKNNTHLTNVQPKHYRKEIIEFCK